MLSVPTQFSKNELACQYIDAAYQALAQADATFVIRAAQVSLSKAVAASVLDNVPLAAEAPTGTGKTLAYLLGGLAASQQFEQRTPLVVATATKALQDQVVEGDFPRLVAAGLAHDSDAVVLKGRSNYLCLRDAEAMQKTLSQGGLEFDEDVYQEEGVPTLELQPLTKLLELYDQGDWTGELDQVRGVAPRDLRGIAMQGDTCSKSKCPRYRACAYFRARDSVKSARVIVTNQDVLLRDLAAQTPLLDIPEYIAVVDEAHHLPDKALSVGASDIRLWEVLNALHKQPGLANCISASAALTAALELSDPSYDPHVSLDTKSALAAAKELSDTLLLLETDTYGVRRFPSNNVPADVLNHARVLLTALEASMPPLNKVLNEAKLLLSISDPTTPDGRLVQEATRRATSSYKVYETSRLGLERFTSRQLKGVRWTEVKEQAASLHFSPLEGAQVLRPLLWTKSRARPVLVSATLRGMDDFGRFSRACGLPDSARKMVLPHVFDHSKSTLTVVGMTFSPKPHERLHYIEELKREISRRVDTSEGTLFLLPSWALLKELTPFLKKTFGDAFVKVQGSGSVSHIVALHKKDIDQKRGSMLVGVASLAEGLDLPGAYCTHVCIAALPFPVPDTPVEKEVAELLGSNYFGQRSLPQASLALTQEIGRLLRRETDTGRITVFDHRLGSTKYGQQMLRAMPPFRVVVEPALR